MYHHAIVRMPGSNFDDGITTADIGAPEFEKAILQHQDYCKALRSCGLSLTILDADPRYPDGCFVEDTAVITEQVAVITQPGHPARKGEQERIAEILSQRMHTEQITGEGKLDGGDILRVGNHFYIGRSDRTNAEGAKQLSSILKKYGYTSSEVPVDAGLHLKSSVTRIGDNTLVATREMSVHFSAHNIIDVGNEEYAANCVNVNSHVLFPMGFPMTRQKLIDAGYELIELDMSEFQKMDGGLTCLSLLM
jgi:dimethylargininase